MEPLKVYLSGKEIFTNDARAFSLYRKSWFGEEVDEKIKYILSEAIYLLENKKIKIYSKNKLLSRKDVMNRFERIDRKIRLKYAVYKNLRNKGYIPKTALKFGADFRIYEKGAKSKKKHARWLLLAEHESNKIALHEFSARNRVAHSTRKKLLLAVVDEENKVTYYEIDWMKP